MKNNGRLCALMLFACCAVSAEGRKACCTADLAAGTNTGESVYNLDDYWADQDGNRTQLGEFKGAVVVLSMFFSSCQYACPRIVADMKKIESLVPGDEKPDVHFILASFDTARDLPPVLKLYAGRNKLPAVSWTLLHGDEEAVRSLAAALGVKYAKDANGDFGHSTIITVLDRNGEIVHQQEGLGTDPDETVRTIERSFRKKD